MILGINPYLIFDGNGQEAITFYEEAVKAKVLHIQTFGEMPENPDYPIPDEAKNRVLHAHLKIADSDLMISDTFPGQPYQLGSQVTISITTTDIEVTKKIFGKLEEGGQVSMPLQETFWSPSYGTVTDKFGITWHVSTYIAEK